MVVVVMKAVMCFYARWDRVANGMTGEWAGETQWSLTAHLGEGKL